MKISLMILICCASIAACDRSDIQDFVAQHGRLEVRGTQLTDEHGEPIVLRGMSFGWHIWWPQFWNADVVRWMKDDWKCTVLRAAVGIEHEGGYLEQPEKAESLLKSVVDACLENGIYVIIDWHDHAAHEHFQQARAFFVEMAELYGEYPHVIYEIYNEPARVEWAAVKEYSEKIIAAIRAVDPDNVILVGSPHWDQDVHIAADDPISGFSNLMYTLHFYAATHKQYLRDRGDYALQKGIPLFVSEYGGCEATGNGPLDMDEWDLWIEWMEANKLSWCKWSIADKDETCSVLQPGADPSGGWALNHLKESGVYARKLIIERNGGNDGNK